MDKLVIQGGHRLQGEAVVSGAKNSILPLLFSTLLAEGKHTFTNVPKLMDVDSSLLLLNHFGCETNFENGRLTINVPSIKDLEAPYDIVRKMRASILCLGPLLVKYRQAKVSLPGGCAIGTRPINIHLESLKQMKAKINVDKGYVLAETSGLTGDSILLDTPSVGATENIMMAATLAEGQTTIENAAKEPEIVDLADYLIKMGAKIKGAGTSIIVIEGVEKLKPAEHKVISDRIEAGTLLIAGALGGDEVTIKECDPYHIESLIYKMKESGLKLEYGSNYVTVFKNNGWKGVDITTAPHPGFPTDLQAQFMTLMTQAEGTSLITENIFEKRFMHVQELVRLNANITPKTRVAIVRGEKHGLTGAPVMATDLRASASLVLAGLVAKGETVVNRIYHLDRGYENLEVKLQKLGAKIKRTK
jgi:UDP-N-acetylglucosamine 1-carboxyvinyltransferase